MKPSNIIDQARAKLIWGEPAEAVRDFLILNGFSHCDAEQKITEFSAERNLDIRKIGIKKIVIGGAISTVTITLLVFSYTSAHHSTSYRSAKGVGIIAFIALYGLWKLIDGIIYLIRPQSETKSITEISE
jgi:hypothetical protein